MLVESAGMQRGGVMKSRRVHGTSRGTRVNAVVGRRCRNDTRVSLDLRLAVRVRVGVRVSSVGVRWLGVGMPRMSVAMWVGLVGMHGRAGWVGSGRAWSRRGLALALEQVVQQTAGSICVIRMAVLDDAERVLEPVEAVLQVLRGRFGHHLFGLADRLGEE